MTEHQRIVEPELTEDGKRIRKIRSFVLREGRLTKGQEAAMKDFWPEMGLDHDMGMLDFAAVFGNDNPVTLEIGFGMGASLVEMAAASPEKNFIGIEVHSPGIGACLMTAGERNITNLRVFCHDAVEVLADCIPDSSLAGMQLFFPDPWHKKRHHKRRIVQADFVEAIRKKLVLGGIFHMATDWEHYATHMVEVMSVAPGYMNTATDGDFVPRPDWRPLTKFEQRGHRLGHGVWDIIYKRTK